MTETEGIAARACAAVVTHRSQVCTGSLLCMFTT